MFDTMINPMQIMVIMMVMGLLPIVLTLVTSYIKIIVVAYIVRNALGIQQTPPNMVLNGLTMILTIFIMAPVGARMYDMATTYIQANQERSSEFSFAVEVVGVCSEPVFDFILKNTDSKVISSFEATARRIWPKEIQERFTTEHPIFLVPAFVISELTKAFQIGFLLYLPFIVIDLIISNILLAMGMMMVSPTTISLPFKLMLFVTLDGWLKLSQGMMLSYNLT